MKKVFTFLGIASVAGAAIFATIYFSSKKKKGGVKKAHTEVSPASVEPEHLPSQDPSTAPISEDQDFREDQDQQVDNQTPVDQNPMEEPVVTPYPEMEEYLAKDPEIIDESPDVVEDISLPDLDEEDDLVETMTPVETETPVVVLAEEKEPDKISEPAEPALKNEEIVVDVCPPATSTTIDEVEENRPKPKTPKPRSHHKKDQA